MDLNGKHSIQRILEGCKKTIVPNKIILAMPKEDEVEIKKRLDAGELDDFIDDRFELFIADGELNNVLDRYYKASRKFDLDAVMRLTADCPMHCGSFKIMDEMFMEYLYKNHKGYMTNNLLISKSPYPCGIDMEIISYEALCFIKMHAKDPYYLEHVVPFLYSGLQTRFELSAFDNIKPHTQITTRIPDFSLDTQEDYEVLLKLTESFDKYNDLNKAIETIDIGGYNKTNISKDFK
jgi:spore coat polysaccharide biosynthesis protein SpsF